MGKIGQLLLSRNWISLPQLTRALKNQSVVGGRLGTCLLEMDALAEEQLAKGLSEQLGLPSAGIEQLHAVAEEVIGVLPAKVARRCHAIPFRLEGNRLDVAMLDPRNLAWHDEVAFASGRRVRVHVAPEIRIFESLERYYGEECPSRFTLLLDRLNRARYLWSEKAREAEAEEPPPEPLVPSRRSPYGLDRFPDLPIPATPRTRGPLLDLPVAARPAPGVPTPAPRIQPPPPGIPAPARIPAPAASIPAPAAATPPAAPAAAAPETAKEPAPRPQEPPPAAPAAAEETPARPAPPSPPRTIALTDAERSSLAGAAIKIDPETAPTTLGELESALETAADPGEIARTLLGFLARRFERTALFQVAREKVSGWLAYGRGVDPDAFARYEVGFDQPSIFLNLERGNNLYLGPLPPMPAHRELAKTWGGDMPRRTAMLPVRVGERMIAVIYVDGGDDAWAGFGLDALNRVRTVSSAALERRILLRRAKPGAA
ncbi:MAG TPA: hypothetical protein VN783_12300 [Thermoanaerobaculia bacterium]|nr:hypothetical protein [Thermoanaerobaculia bacterium]